MVNQLEQVTVGDIHESEAARSRFGDQQSLVENLPKSTKNGLTDDSFPVNGPTAIALHVENVLFGDDEAQSIEGLGGFQDSTIVPQICGDQNHVGVVDVLDAIMD